ncbi:hypothetical protein [Polaromonas sp. DSR2-3-2]|uniref:hypothetical protein n=1 Tax=unclassified Polaromonas TaxID=2638319 RepID=UPI003CF555E9
MLFWPLPMFSSPPDGKGISALRSLSVIKGSFLLLGGEDGIAGRDSIRAPFATDTAVGETLCDLQHIRRCGLRVVHSVATRRFSP